MRSRCKKIRIGTVWRCGSTCGGSIHKIESVRRNLEPGGTGVLGKNIVPRLHERGYLVRARLRSGRTSSYCDQENPKEGVHGTKEAIQHSKRTYRQAILFCWENLHPDFVHCSCKWDQMLISLGRGIRDPRPVLPLSPRCAAHPWSRSGRHSLLDKRPARKRSPARRNPPLAHKWRLYYHHTRDDGPPSASILY